MHEPKEAMTWAKGLGEGDRGRAMAEVANSWAMVEPESAASYVEGLPPSPERKRAATRVAERWATHDPDAALAWMSETVDASDRDSVASIVTSWAHDQPERAWAWIGKQEDPEAQRRYYSSAYAVLYARDKQLAERVVDESQLDPDFRASLSSSVSSSKKRCCTCTADPE